MTDAYGFYSQYIASIIGAICMFILFIYHYKTSKQISKKCIPPKFLTCSILLLINGILYCLSGLSEVVFSEYILVNETVCTVHFILILGLYSSFKLILYIALCRRVIESFGEALTYSNTFLISYQIILIVATLMINCFMWNTS